MNKNRFFGYLLMVLAAWLAVPADGQAVFGLFDRHRTVTAIDGEVRLPLHEFADGNARHYAYKTEEKEVLFFVVKSPDGVIRAAFDACDVCFHARKGYRQDGLFMICTNCGQRFHLNRINQVEGGCNPAPLTRTESGENLVIKVADLLPGGRFF